MSRHLRSPARDRLRGLLALLALATVLVGIPLATVTVAGWPFPSRMPPLSGLGRSLSEGVTDATLVRIISGAVLVVWAYLAGCALGEVALIVLRRERRTNRRANPLALSMHRLVGAVALLATTAASIRPSSAAMLPGSIALPVGPGARAVVSANPRKAATPAHAATVVVGPRDSLFSIASKVLGDGNRRDELVQLNRGRVMNDGLVFEEDLRPGWQLLVPAPAAGAATVTDIVVQPGDSLSSLAEHHLGSETAWPRLWAANRGRVFDGRTFDDPNLILPGWTLTLPASLDPAATRSTTVGQLPPTAAAQAQPAETAVAAGNSAPAETAPAAGGAAPPEAGASPAASDTAGAAAAPLGITAGGVGSVSASVAPSTSNILDGTGQIGRGPAAHGDSRAATQPGASQAPAQPTHASSAADAHHDGELRPGIPMGIATATLLATGAASLLASRRMRQLRTMRPGDALALPDPDLAPVETALRVGADPVGMARLDLSLRALARQLAHVPPIIGRPEIVVRRPDGSIEVWLDQPVAPVQPGPWVRIDAHVIVLPASISLDALARATHGAAAPCPALMLLGRADGSEYYLDLEAAGVLALDGPPAAVRAIARAVVATLSVSPLADLVSVLACGLDCYGIAGTKRVDAVASVSATIGPVRAHADAIGRAAELLGSVSTFDLRARSSGEPWEPLVVVALGPDDDEPSSSASRLSSELGVAVVTGGAAPDAPWRLVAGDDERTWRLEPAGIDLVPCRLAADELADLGALLRDASEPAIALTEPGAAPAQGGDELDRRSERGIVASATTAASSTTYVEPDHVLLVRLLGPVEVVDRAGRPALIERSKALELVVWLAQHRHHPTRSAARTALWATDVRDATFANIVSDARRSLARLVPPPAGREWIGRSGNDHLPLDALVRTDVELVEARLARARQVGPSEALPLLRSALELVRGMPYAGTSYLWPDAEALPSNLTHLVTSVAVELGRSALQLGDIDAVLWATARGLQVLSGHEELVCLRMRALANAGNIAAVRLEYESYERVVTNDPWGDGEPSASVVAMRDELLTAPTR
jgi:hypothetical protein